MERPTPTSHNHNNAPKQKHKKSTKKPHHKKHSTNYVRTILPVVKLLLSNPKSKKPKKVSKSKHQEAQPKILIIDQINIKQKNKDRDYSNENTKLSMLRSSMRCHPRFGQSVNDFHDKTTSMMRVSRTFNKLDDLSQLLKNSLKYKQARQAKTDFIDQEFPRGTDAIVGFVQGETTSKHLDFVWRRPEQFYVEYFKNQTLYYKKETTDKYKVYDRVRPEDVIQGKLGDCYFLAACGAIALNPARLERLFISGKDYNPRGLYAVAVCINGIWEEVLLDDYFPCNKKTLTPAYTKSRSRYLWPMLLEKAWAKVHLGYLNIASGQVRDALRDLTGAPIKSLSLKEQDLNGKGIEHLNKENLKTWEYLLEAFTKNFVICASTRNFNQGSDEVDSSLGISGNHAYSVLGVYDMGKGRTDFEIIIFWF